MTDVALAYFDPRESSVGRDLSADGLLFNRSQRMPRSSSSRSIRRSFELAIASIIFFK
jgi:hypothetical protein